MYSGHDSISTQNHAGKSRTPQATQDNKILEITHNELRELQHTMLLHTQSKGKISERKSTIHIANLDTNSILKQIRARKTQETSKSQNDNDMEDEISNLEIDEQEDNEEEMEDEENYFDPEENTVYEETEDNNMDYDEESTTEEQDNDSVRNEQESMENDNNIISEGKLATNCDQIGQSSAIDNEPPTPPREGGGRG